MRPRTIWPSGLHIQVASNILWLLGARREQAGPLQKYYGKLLFGGHSFHMPLYKLYHWIYKVFDINNWQHKLNLLVGTHFSPWIPEQSANLDTHLRFCLWIQQLVLRIIYRLLKIGILEGAWNSLDFSQIRLAEPGAAKLCIFQTHPWGWVGFLSSE